MRTRSRIAAIAVHSRPNQIKLIIHDNKLAVHIDGSWPATRVLSAPISDRRSLAIFAHRIGPGAALKGREL